MFEIADDAVEITPLVGKRSPLVTDSEVTMDGKAQIRGSASEL